MKVGQFKGQTWNDINPSLVIKYRRVYIVRFGWSLEVTNVNIVHQKRSFKVKDERSWPRPNLVHSG
jgi:hypothetical protein